MFLLLYFAILHIIPFFYVSVYVCVNVSLDFSQIHTLNNQKYKRTVSLKKEQNEKKKKHNLKYWNRIIKKHYDITPFIRPSIYLFMWHAKRWLLFSVFPYIPWYCFSHGLDPLFIWMNMSSKRLTNSTYSFSLPPHTHTHTQTRQKI